MTELRETVDLMLSDNFRDRLKAEYWQNVIRYNALSMYIDKLKNSKNPYESPVPIKSLERQLTYMSLMNGVLEERLAADDINADEEISEEITLADVLDVYEGTREYEGIVDTIQKWYYGYLSKTAWCATTICWALAQLGLRVYTLNGKTDNVYQLNTLLNASAKKGNCKIISKPAECKRGDIVILCFDSVFNLTASKHVTVFNRPLIGNKFEGIGGNQSDSIRYSNYDMNNIIAVYRPDYEMGTLETVETLPLYTGA